MQIVCATPQAAAQVLTILYAAQFQPIRDFTIQPVLSILPTLIFTLLVVVPAMQMTKIRLLPDTTVT